MPWYCQILCQKGTMPKKIMPKRDYALKGYANLQANLFFTPKKATVHESKKLFECDVCSAEFADETSLNDHCSKEHEEKKQTTISSFFTPKNATNVHETKKPFTCDVCSAEFTEFTFLTDHVSTEHDESKHEEGIQICHNILN